MIAHTLARGQLSPHYHSQGAHCPPGPLNSLVQGLRGDEGGDDGDLGGDGGEGAFKVVFSSGAGTWCDFADWQLPSVALLALVAGVAGAALQQVYMYISVSVRVCVCVHPARLIRACVQSPVQRGCLHSGAVLHMCAAPSAVLPPLALSACPLKVENKEGAAVAPAASLATLQRSPPLSLATRDEITGW